jgi:hypothetical protein
MGSYDRLMRELALMAALKDLIDDTDADPLRAPLNRAWSVARKRAADAAEAYVQLPD